MSWRGTIVCLVALAAPALAIPDDDSVSSFLKMPFVEDPKNAGQDAGLKQTNCSCGYTNKGSEDGARIFGGEETKVNEFPYMAGLLVQGGGLVYCGGTIITEYHVLTAGHCTAPPYSTMSKSVVVGEHRQFDRRETKSTVVIRVEKHIQHPKYKNFNWDKKKTANDVSLLVLSEKIKFSEAVGPACLPTEHMDLVKEQLKTLGWGGVERVGVHSEVLNKVSMRVIPLKHCHKLDSAHIHIPMDKPKQLCIVGNKKDTCEGDAGGPALWLDPEANRYTLVGVVTERGYACGGNQPFVVTEVFPYMKWIRHSIAATKPEAKTCSKIG